MSAGDRVQLYKIRRLVAPLVEPGTHLEDPPSHYEYVSNAAGHTVDRYADIKWTRDRIDAYAFTKYSEAQRICERLKVLNKDPNVLYHAVVPA